MYWDRSGIIIDVYDKGEQRIPFIMVERERFNW